MSGIGGQDERQDGIWEDIVRSTSTFKDFVSQIWPKSIGPIAPSESGM